MKWKETCTTGWRILWRGKVTMDPYGGGDFLDAGLDLGIVVSL